MVVQRDGLPSGRALFKVDVEKQKAIEFTKDQRAKYNEVFGAKLDESLKKKRGGNPDADSSKRSKTTGDI